MGSILLFGLIAIVVCWIILTLMGGERERQLQHVEAARRAAQAAAAAAAFEAAKKPQPAPVARQSAR